MPDENKDTPLVPCFKCVYAEALENEPNIKCQHPLVKKFKERAIDQGPGGWPFNYSPEWIESCNGLATEKPEEPKPQEAKDAGEPESTKVEETEKVEEKTPAEEEKKDETVEPEEKPVGELPEDKQIPPDDESDKPPFTFGKSARKSGKGK
jgi:hypothetical protein